MKGTNYCKVLHLDIYLYLVFKHKVTVLGKWSMTVIYRDAEKTGDSIDTVQGKCYRYKLSGRGRHSNLGHTPGVATSTVWSTEAYVLQNTTQSIKLGRVNCIIY